MRNELHLTAEEMPDVAKQAAFTQAHLKQMGVKIFDDKGNMRSMIDIFKDMGAVLKDASDQEKLSTVKAVFGDRASAGALAIFNHIQTGRLDEVLTKVKNADGAAQQMAERMQIQQSAHIKNFCLPLKALPFHLVQFFYRSWLKLCDTVQAGQISLVPWPNNILN